MIYEKQIKLLNPNEFEQLRPNNKPNFHNVEIPTRADNQLTQSKKIEFSQNLGTLTGVISSLRDEVNEKINKIIYSSGGRKKRNKKTRKVKKTRKKSKKQKNKKTKKRKKKRKMRKKKKTRKKQERNS